MLCREEPREEPSEERVLGPIVRQAWSIEEGYHHCLMWSVVHPPLPCHAWFTTAALCGLWFTHQCLVMLSYTTALSCNHTPLHMQAWPTAA